MPTKKNPRIRVVLQGYLHRSVYFSAACRDSRTCNPLVRIHTLRKVGTYLELNLGLGNILLAATAAGNLLRLGNLCADSLQDAPSVFVRPSIDSTDGGKAYINREVLQREALHSVDAELGVGLDDGETTRHYFQTRTH